MATSHLEKSPIEARIIDVVTYPVKSLPGISRHEGVLITENGLQGDRVFTMARMGKLGEVASRLTLREYPQLALLTTAYANGGVELAAPDGNQLWLPDSAEGDRVQVKSWGGVVDGVHVSQEANAWLSDYLHTSAQFLSVPDDHRRTMAEDEQRDAATIYTGRATDGYPLHIASLASLRRLNAFRQEQGLDALGIEQFRANIIIDGEHLEPFVEDAMKNMLLQGRERQVRILSIKACERCVTVEVNPATGMKHGNVLASLRSTQSEHPTDGKIVFGTWAAPSITSVGEVIQRDQSIHISV